MVRKICICKFISDLYIILFILCCYTVSCFLLLSYCFSLFIVDIVFLVVIFVVCCLVLVSPLLLLSLFPLLFLLFVLCCSCCSCCFLFVACCLLFFLLSLLLLLQILFCFANFQVVPTYGTLGTAVSLHFTADAFSSRLLKDAPETVARTKRKPLKIGWMAMFLWDFCCGNVWEMFGNRLGIFVGNLYECYGYFVAIYPLVSGRKLLGMNISAIRSRQRIRFLDLLMVISYFPDNSQQVFGTMFSR